MTGAVEVNIEGNLMSLSLCGSHIFLIPSRRKQNKKKIITPYPKRNVSEIKPIDFTVLVDQSQRNTLIST